MVSRRFEGRSLVTIIGWFIRIGKKFQSQGFPQQQLHTTNMDNKSELNLDRLIHFRATNSSIYSNHISSDSTKVINCRSQTLIK